MYLRLFSLFGYFYGPILNSEYMCRKRTCNSGKMMDRKVHQWTNQYSCFRRLKWSGKCSPEKRPFHDLLPFITVETICFLHFSWTIMSGPMLATDATGNISQEKIQVNMSIGDVWPGNTFPYWYSYEFIGRVTFACTVSDMLIKGLQKPQIGWWYSSLKVKLPWLKTPIPSAWAGRTVNLLPLQG